VKYRVGSGEWQHARLNDTGNSSGMHPSHLPTDSTSNQLK
jgi:hypothetical protein